MISCFRNPFFPFTTMALGRNYIDTVATELWSNCWQYCDHITLKRLSLSCRYFRTTCQPLLFQEQRVSVPGVDATNWIQSTWDIHNTTLRLRRLAASDLAAAVRVFVWTGNSRLDRDLSVEFPRITHINVLCETLGRLVATFASTIGAYRQLRVLHIAELTVDEGIRAALVTLPLLDNLTVHQCSIPCRTGTLVPVRKFRFFGMNSLSNKDIEIVAPNRLEDLFLTAIGAEQGIDLLSALTRQLLPCLVKLTIVLSDEASNIFFRFLNACPTLESLNIQTMYLPLTIFPLTLPPTTIPILNSFEGPDISAGLFARERPVTRVSLHSRTMGKTAAELIPIIRDVARGSVPLRSLAISGSIFSEELPKLFAAVRTLFPGLQSLSIRLHPTGESSVESSLTSLSTFSGDDGAAAHDGEDNAIDDRIVELWDGSPPPREQDYENIELIEADIMSDDGVENPPPNVPIIELPGHMYLSAGASYPPVFDDVPVTDSTSAMTVVMDMIYTEHIELPPLLEVLRFGQEEDGFPLSEQHRAVLALEQLLPCVKEVALDGISWVRMLHVWVTESREVDRYSKFNHVPARVISQLWNADGTMRS
ncbi:hypothetical protein C8R43DRAFT_1239352 [Mycena crocata]|nr:hypothetical protein C8R43DRAFT_1239352 [Mycena crocata]